MWKQDESGRVHTPLEPVVLGATLALIPVLIIEADATSHAWQEVATVANWIIWAIFLAELATVLVIAPPEESCPACSLARRGDRRSHDPALGKSVRLVPTRTLLPPPSLRGHRVSKTPPRRRRSAARAEALSKSMRGFRKARQLPGLSITRCGRVGPITRDAHDRLRHLFEIAWAPSGPDWRTWTSSRRRATPMAMAVVCRRAKSLRLDAGALRGPHRRGAHGAPTIRPSGLHRDA